MSEDIMPGFLNPEEVYDRLDDLERRIIALEGKTICTWYPTDDGWATNCGNNRYGTPEGDFCPWCGLGIGFLCK